MFCNWSFQPPIQLRRGAIYSHVGWVDFDLAGAPDSAIMRQGRWSSSTVVAKYNRGESAGDAPVARMNLPSRLISALLSRAPRPGLPFTKQGKSFPQAGTGNTRDENRPGDRARSVSWFQSRIQPGVRDVSLHPWGE